MFIWVQNSFTHCIDRLYPGEHWKLAKKNIFLVSHLSVNIYEGGFEIGMLATYSNITSYNLAWEVVNNARMSVYN